VEVAVELAEESGDEAALAFALSVAFHAVGSLGRGYPQELLDRALALEGSVDFFYVADRPTYILANTIEPEGDGKRLLSLLLSEAQDRGDEPSTGLLQFNLGYCEWMTGNWERALTLLSEADQLRDQQTQAFRGIKALIEASLGDVEAARADALGSAGEPAASNDGEAAHSQSDAPDTPVYFHSGRWALGFLALSEGDPAEVHRNLWPLWEAARRAGFGDPYWYPFAADEIEALVELDQLDQAGSMLDWLEERGRTQDRPRTLASAGRCRGLLHAAEDDLGRAIVSIDEALELHKRIEAPFEHARTLLAQGAILRRVGRKRTARESLEEALATFERLPAPLWAAKAKAELARIGGRQAVPGALTEAEQRVAYLAVAGRTNREIAETLFLSARTVESHLSHTYHKLGVRSRTELASALEAAHPHP
jgi:DNA-binding CsgD family transcriptional regulator